VESTLKFASVLNPSNFRCTSAVGNSCENSSASCANGTSSVMKYPFFTVSPTSHQQITMQGQQPLSLEPVVSFQASVSALTGGNVTIASAVNGITRVTLQIPPEAFIILNSGGQEQPNATTTQFSISPVSPSYLSTLSVPLTNIISNVVDISLQGISFICLFPN